MPVIAILLAMARILSALLFAIGDHDDRRGGRVWIRVQQVLTGRDEAHHDLLSNGPGTSRIQPSR